MLYERTALSKKPDRLIRQELDKLRSEGALTPDLVLQDPYLLDFLGLKERGWTPGCRGRAGVGRNRTWVPASTAAWAMF